VAEKMRQDKEKRWIEAELAEMEARARESQVNEQIAMDNAHNAELVCKAAEKEAYEGLAKAETEKEEAWRAVKAAEKDMDEVKTKWKMGVEPDFMPTLEDLQRAKFTSTLKAPFI
jgi:hypothetical protein